MAATSLRSPRCCLIDLVLLVAVVAIVSGALLPVLFRTVVLFRTAVSNNLPSCYKDVSSTGCMVTAIVNMRSTEATAGAQGPQHCLRLKHVGADEHVPHEAHACHSIEPRFSSTACRNRSSVAGVGPWIQPQSTEA